MHYSTLYILYNVTYIWNTKNGWEHWAITWAYLLTFNLQISGHSSSIISETWPWMGLLFCRTIFNLFISYKKSHTYLVGNLATQRPLSILEPLPRGRVVWPLFNIDSFLGKEKVSFCWLVSKFLPDHYLTRIALETSGSDLGKIRLLCTCLKKVWT